MTEEELAVFVELDNAARAAVAAIELAARVQQGSELPPGAHALTENAQSALEAYHGLVRQHGASALPKKAAKVADEPGGLSEALRADYRALRQRIKDGEPITMGPTKPTKAYKRPSFIKAVAA